jgi:CelD/BcsL family acetyltransferase involved in cellulose biosynthesis
VTLYEIDPLRDQRWVQLIEQHPKASLFHTPEWLNALQCTYSYEPVAFTDAAPGVPLQNALLFCRVRSWMTGPRLVSLPFSDHCEPLVESRDTLGRMLDALQSRLGNEGRYIEMRPLTAVSGAHGFVPSAEYCIHTVDIRSELPAVFSRFHRNHVQRSIRKAERLDVQVDAGRSPDLLDRFYALHMMTRRRHGVPVQPLSWFRNVVDSLGDRVVVQIAKHQGRSVAAIVTAAHERTLVYKYGCSDAAYNRLGATPLLFWRAIQAAKDRGLEELDLGRTDLDNEGLLAFKDHLGGTRRALTYFRCSVNGSAVSGKSWTPTIARHAYGLAPRSIQASLSRAFYRHFA